MTELPLVASTNEPPIGVDVNARIIDWNAGATRLFGYIKAKVAGKRRWEVLCGAGSGFIHLPTRIFTTRKKRTDLFF